MIQKEKELSRTGRCLILNRTALCIKMLELLSTKRIYKIAELAELLETNPRNILEYKKELEVAGYYIESIPGKYGGYYLNQNNLIYPINFTDEERKIFNHGIDYVLSRNEFLQKKDFEIVVSKIQTAINQKNNFNELIVINRFPLAMPEIEVMKRYKAVSECIEGNYVLEIEYLSQKNINKKYNVHPYKLFVYNNSWFIIALNEKHDSISYYKLNRIINYSITNQIFKKKSDFNVSDYLDEYGMKNYGEWFKIEAFVFNQYASLIKERVYGKNQKIETIDDKTTYISVEMQNYESIKTFILGFGSNIKVINPQTLIEELLIETNKINAIYQKK